MYVNKSIIFKFLSENTVITMQNQDETFDTICRVCLNHEKPDKMVSLVSDSEENGLSPYGVSFEKITNICIKQNNHFPTNMCHECKKSLEAVASFIITSGTSDSKLTRLVNFSLKQDLNADMVKEVVRQYTLFNKNFLEDSNLCSSQASTSNYCEDSIQTFSENCVSTKAEGLYSKIKVEVDVQQISEDNASDDANGNLNSYKNSLSDSDNINIFLYSVEKLLTTKIEDIEKTAKKCSSTKEKFKKESKEKAPVQDFTCNICFRVLANPHTYRHHMERHGVCRYVCDQCGKGFPVLAELTQHQIYRHGIGSTLICDQCNFKAARRLELIEHIRLHTGERPFTCEICGLTFRRKAIYKNHMKFHGEKMIVCDYCPRKFFRRSEMLAHSNNIHDRVYVFLCTVCNVTYAMAKTVRRHMLVKHGIPRHKQGKVVKIHKNSSNATNFFKEAKEGEDNFTVL